ncbi:MAG: thymidine phosphorylase [Rhizobacter sp.]|nr:thymidine phosphorylase [Chlorobiales bacterium]
MTPVELIRKKRDGLELTDAELEFFFSEYLRGHIPDYQVSAMLMAIFFRSLSEREMRTLCHTMIHTGAVMDLDAVPAVKVDKHSTGGVGDKTSLILAPIVASLGIAVPMISGRGLGHTGGTLDKLESIIGFNVNLSPKQFIAQLKKHHCALIGQTKELAPLDKLLYALRDTTGTVESIPLIASSIMSKKIASGLDALVLDVKTGRGAFMQDYKKSKELARTLIQVGEDAGKRVMAFITDMNEPLGYAVGNWLEVIECAECLQGNDARSKDLMEVSLTLSGAMLVLGKRAKSVEEGIHLSQAQIQSGAAWQKFLEIIKAQGGDTNILQDFKLYPKPKFNGRVLANANGFISEIDSLEIGLAAVQLGAGRLKKEDTVEFKSGVAFSRKVGDKVQKGDVILEFFTDKKSEVDIAKRRLAAAVTFSPKPVRKKKKVLEQL